MMPQTRCWDNVRIAFLSLFEVVIGVATYHRKILCINNFVLFQLKLHQKLIINLGMTTPNCCICIFRKTLRN